MVASQTYHLAEAHFFGQTLTGKAVTTGKEGKNSFFR
jgi:hypothetical protein